MVKILKKKAKTTGKTRQKSGSVNSFWKNLGDLVPDYLDHVSASKKKQIHSEIKKIEENINKSAIPGFIAEHFVRPFIPSENGIINVLFSGEENGKFGTWIAQYQKELKTLRINSVGLFAYSEIYKNIETSLSAVNKEDHFTAYRFFSFAKEIAKLPEQYLIFIAILKSIAEVTGITISDARNASNSTDPHTSSYLSTLWALKQFEEFYQKIQNRSVRADYHIIWHEGEWVSA